jgi:hypothetical protein
LIELIACPFCETHQRSGNWIQIDSFTFSLSVSRDSAQGVCM